MILEYAGGAFELGASIDVNTEGEWVSYLSLIGVDVRTRLSKAQTSQLHEVRPQKFSELILNFRVT